MPEGAYVCNVHAAARSPVRDGVESTSVGRLAGWSPGRIFEDDDVVHERGAETQEKTRAKEHERQAKRSHRQHCNHATNKQTIYQLPRLSPWKGVTHSNVHAQSTFSSPPPHAGLDDE